MEISQLPIDKKVVLFDGVCNLCDSLVQYIIKHDKNDVFRFASLQSDLGVKILQHIGVDPKTDSVVFYQPGVAYYENSGAVIEIARALGWPVSAWFLSLVPKFLRDPIYVYVAKNRYKWYGKKENCLVPTPETKSKFL